ncbi:hypothetical protein [Adhaeribacter rhizoryzae]|uniref:DUF4007 family protein n=1 Tax=Adhaeribacter rhizoryzae TaxID=2607907 RepID=A0A5M6DLC6_9BACT|nr:hypothetical protein [Adhaeribacter rhizoryzae]KAA5548347.1 hypothetical protein F0145_06375 [Adhaeribacter rhizoryzae]
MPFFHLRGSYFWNHKVLPNRETGYNILTTSGGGSKRIIENIEYAYFSDDVWILINNDNSLCDITSTIMLILNNQNSPNAEAGSQKLKTSFSESFRMSRSGLSQILSAFISSEKNKLSIPTETFLKEYTTLGQNQVIANLNYARGSGLIKRNGEITNFGYIVYDNDPSLSRIETQWLLHYFISVEHELGPEFWGKTIANRFLIGNALNKKEIAEFIFSASIEAGEKQLAFGTYEVAATSLLGSYSANDGLVKLGILEGPEKNSYMVRTPQTIPTNAFACILADYWQANFPSSASIDEEQLTKSNLPKLLLLGVDGFNAKLAELAAPQLGLVQRQRRFDPPQILRRWTDKEPLWTALYA